MTEEQFRQHVAAQGFDTVVPVEREPNGALGLHTHPFEAMALVVAGEITIVVDGDIRRCGPGDTFHLGPNIPHTEQYGPQGVRYLAARK